MVSCYNNFSIENQLKFFKQLKAHRENIVLKLNNQIHIQEQLIKEYDKEINKLSNNKEQ